jgi:acid phosphatase family membrane protein YuiD
MGFITPNGGDDASLAASNELIIYIIHELLVLYDVTFRRYAGKDARVIPAGKLRLARRKAGWKLRLHRT